MYQLEMEKEGELESVEGEANPESKPDPPEALVSIMRGMLRQQDRRDKGWLKGRRKGEGKLSGKRMKRV